MASLAGRRLAELLQEQQEPFLLDVYLVENGYSSRVLCSDAAATCWPAGNTCRRLQRLASHGFQRRGERILGSLLGVFAGRRPQKSPNWGRGAGFIERMETKTRSTLGKINVDAERAHGWECTEEPKQLSPVSVLELQSEDGSPAHGHTKEEEPSTSGLYVPAGVMDVLRQLHGCASSTYIGTKEESHGSRHALLAACVKEGDQVEEERSLQRLYESLGSHRAGKSRRARRRRAGEAMAVSQLAESDVLNYSGKWNQFSCHVMEVGAEVVDSILDQVIEDLISHL